MEISGVVAMVPDQVSNPNPGFKEGKRKVIWPWIE